jgi:hypothetical protein
MTGRLCPFAAGGGGHVQATTRRTLKAQPVRRISHSMPHTHRGLTSQRASAPGMRIVLGLPRSIVRGRPRSQDVHVICVIVRDRHPRLLVTEL